MKSIPIALALVLASSAAGAEQPAGDEVRKVMEFYRHGQGQGIVMSETRLCADIVREGENRNECDMDLEATGAAKGQPVYLWMSFMVPEGDEARVRIDFEQGGTTHYKKDFSVSGSLRYRAWRRMKFPRSGEWTAKVYQDLGDKSVLLGSKTFQVSDAAPAAAAVEKPAASAPVTAQNPPTGSSPAP